MRNALLFALIISHLQAAFISYSIDGQPCMRCASYHLDLSEKGAATYGCKRSCAVPGTLTYRLSPDALAQLTALFTRSNFVAIPEHGSGAEDAPIIHISFNGHEVIDEGRNIPSLTTLEPELLRLTGVKRYLKPSVSLYQSLLRQG